MKIEDLDVLRPEARWIKLNGTEIDVSFIPCGLTFEVDALSNQLRSLDMKALQEGNEEEAKKAFSLSIKMCVVFCSHVNPEMDEDWFNENASIEQIERLATIIKELLVSAYAGIEAPKNVKRTKGRK